MNPIKLPSVLLTMRQPSASVPVVLVVEEAEVDGGGALGEEGEVDALAVPGGAERVGLAGPDPHCFGSTL